MRGCNRQWHAVKNRKKCNEDSETNSDNSEHCKNKRTVDQDLYSERRQEQTMDINSCAHNSGSRSDGGERGEVE